MEDQAALKKSCNGYLGDLGRRYKQLEQLLLDRDNYSVVVKRYDQLKGVFSLYEEQYMEYVTTLDGDIKTDASKVFASQQQNLEEFNKRITAWLSETESKEVSFTAITTPVDDDQRSEKYAASTSSSSSRSSARLREAKLKQRIARQRMEQLKEQQRLERARRELDERLVALQIDGEMKHAELEVEMLEEELIDDQVPAGGRDLTAVQVPTGGEDSHGRKDDLIGGQSERIGDKDQIKNNGQISSDRSARTVSSNTMENRDAVDECCSPVACDVDAQSRVNMCPNENMGNNVVVKTSSQNAVGNGNSVSDLCNMLMVSMNMPKPELIRFDGDPIKYCSFMNSFDVNVACKVNDDKTRLMYLLSYCEGRAKECIECCVLLPSDEGYSRARKILANQFGQPHVISHARLKKVLNRPQIRPNDGHGLCELAREMSACQITLEQMGHTADMNSGDNLLKIQGILPVQLQARWADRAEGLLTHGVEPSFRHMADFVDRQAKVANNLYGKNVGQGMKPASVRPPNRPSSSGKRATTLSTGKGDKQNANSKSECPCCAERHELTECRKFKGKTQNERFRLVRRNRLCDNCLKPFHMANDCWKKSVCGSNGCERKHHTLLHFRRAENPTGAGESSKGGETTDAQGKPLGTSLSASMSSKVCLRVLPVKVQSEGREVETWALLDSGSDVSLCDERLAAKLGLTGKRKQFQLSTVNHENKDVSGMELSMSVCGLNESESISLEAVWTVDKLPISADSIPQPSDMNQWSHLRDVSIPQIDEKEVMLLIGGDTPEAFWVKEDRRGGKGDPYAMRSALGWTIIGPTSRRGKRSRFTSNFTRMQDDLLHAQVERFWELDFGDNGDEVGKGLSVEDRRAEATFKETITKSDGHYELGLPWRHAEVGLPDSRKMTERRLDSLKRRLAKDPAMHERYTAIVEGYVKNGYAQELTKPELSSGKTWYLPHHPVIHPQKGKVRVVFDCAARSHGTSLNDQLLQGPDYNNNLVGVLMRFREDKVALMADIEAMFHQVKVSPNDSDALRFLWWPNGDLDITPKVYRMVVHLFGATSSPSCATFALRKTAEDNGGVGFEKASKAVNENFYVDDCLVSVGTKQEAIELASSLRELLSAGGFRLTKWVSNSYDVIASIPPSERAASVVDLDLDNPPMERTLGVSWDVETDAFTFKVSPKEKPPSRRGVLSVTSSLYDPLGFVAPVVLVAKILLQDICTQGLGWDQTVGEDEQERWTQWLAELPQLEKTRIERCLKPKTGEEVTRHDLHIFCDASQRGYAAVAYLRTEDEKENVHCAFVMGKTRLSPVKTVSIPRLELSAALLAVQVAQCIQVELKLPIDTTTYWTDSTSVLQYIQNESRRFQTFVANRVAKIQEATDVSQWRFVDTKSNPADEGSRGMSASELTIDARWIKGPQFLWEEPERWPQAVHLPQTLPEADKDPEIKRTARSNCVTSSGKVDDLIGRYSSWSRLKKGVAWILRFVRYLRSKVKSEDDKEVRRKTLTIKEYRDAERAILRYIQMKEFPEELGNHDKNANKRNGSSLRKLNPAVVDGMLRVGGRLTNAPVPYDTKHPVILPSDHHVTRLLIIHHHMIVGHSGAGATWASLRERFWIIRGGAMVRKTIGGCFACKRRNAARGQQLMADLPSDRVSPDKPPFSSVGIDFFGPLYVKQGRSRVKRYGCIFTCLASRAVHLEVAHTLETDSFINVLRRFMSRRGKPDKIRSDNGTNFKGAERELRESLAALNESKVAGFLHQRNIEWQFNPPTASHMGGVWERMIRTVRKILKGILGEQLVNDEVLATTLAEVEGILNARPLTKISQDPNDMEPLTPNHLLLMKQPHCLPPGIFKKEDQYCRRRWRQTQYLADLFWKRWRREYLPSLQERQRWLRPRRNFKVDDLVLMVDDNAPRGQWSIGKIVETYPGRDGKVRSVEVKAGTKFYKRPIAKLCLLEQCGPNARENEA